VSTERRSVRELERGRETAGRSKGNDPSNRIERPKLPERQELKPPPAHYEGGAFKSGDHRPNNGVPGYGDAGDSPTPGSNETPKVGGGGSDGMHSGGQLGRVTEAHI
jgi:hypothetical protein